MKLVRGGIEKTGEGGWGGGVTSIRFKWLGDARMPDRSFTLQMGGGSTLEDAIYTLP